MQSSKNLFKTRGVITKSLSIIKGKLWVLSTSSILTLQVLSKPIFCSNTFYGSLDSSKRFHCCEVHAQLLFLYLFFSTEDMVLASQIGLLSSDGEQ